jgi:hypothetical protein
MSVLACSRRGCPSVMCDRLSHKHGYICHECFEELVALGVKTDIDEFLDSPRKDANKDAARAYFETIFPMPRD